MDARKEKFGLLLLLFLMLSSNWNSNAFAAEPIQLLGGGKIELDSNRLYLKDLVRIEGADAELKAKVGQIEMGTTPPLGRDRKIDERDIRLQLKQAQIDLNQIEILLSEPIWITQKYMEVSSGYIEEAVREFIKKQARFKDSKVTVKEVNWTGQVQIPSGKLTHQVQKKPQVDLMGNVPLYLFLYVDGQLQKRLVVFAQVNVTANVAVAVKPISRGQFFQLSDFKLIAMELSKIKGRPLGSVDEIVGKRANRQIYPQQVILENDVEIPPVLKRGDMVNIVVAFENLVATTRGEVRENGRIGEEIKVVNIDSKKSLSAVVVDRHTVKIVF